MKIKKRKLFEAVEDMGSDSTAAMGENVENFEGIDVAEAFKKLNKLDEQALNEQKLNEASYGRFNQHYENQDAIAFVSAFRSDISNERKQRYRDRLQDVPKKYAKNELDAINYTASGDLRQSINYIAGRIKEDDLVDKRILDAIKADARHFAIGYNEIRGCYPETTETGEVNYVEGEKTVMVYAPKDYAEKLFEFAVSLGKIYDQESILFIFPSGKAYWIYTKNTADNKIGDYEFQGNKPSLIEIQKGFSKIAERRFSLTPYMYEFKVVYTVNGEEQEDIIWAWSELHARKKIKKKNRGNHIIFKSFEILSSKVFEDDENNSEVFTITEGAKFQRTPILEYRPQINMRHFYTTAYGTDCLSKYHKQLKRDNRGRKFYFEGVDVTLKPKKSNIAECAKCSETFTESIDNTYDALRALDKLDD